MQAAKVSTVQQSRGLLQLGGSGGCFTFTLQRSQVSLRFCCKLEGKHAQKEAATVLLSGAWHHFKTAATKDFMKLTPYFLLCSPSDAQQVSGKAPSQLPSYPLPHLQAVKRHSTHRNFTKYLIPFRKKNTSLVQLPFWLPSLSLTKSFKHLFSVSCLSSNSLLFSTCHMQFLRYLQRRSQKLEGQEALFET